MHSFYEFNRKEKLNPFSCDLSKSINSPSNVTRNEPTKECFASKPTQGFAIILTIYVMEIYAHKKRR